MILWSLVLFWCWNKIGVSEYTIPHQCVGLLHFSVQKPVAKFWIVISMNILIYVWLGCELQCEVVRSTCTCSSQEQNEDPILIRLIYISFTMAGSYSFKKKVACQAIIMIFHSELNIHLIFIFHENNLNNVHKFIYIYI